MVNGIWIRGVEGGVVAQHFRNMVIMKTFAIKNAIYFSTLNIFSFKINVIVDFYQPAHQQELLHENCQSSQKLRNLRKLPLLQVFLSLHSQPLHRAAAAS